MTKERQVSNGQTAMNTSNIDIVTLRKQSPFLRNVVVSEYTLMFVPLEHAQLMGLSDVDRLYVISHVSLNTKLSFLADDPLWKILEQDVKSKLSITDKLITVTNKQHD